MTLHVRSLQRILRHFLDYRRPHWTSHRHHPSSFDRHSMKYVDNSAGPLNIRLATSTCHSHHLSHFHVTGSTCALHSSCPLRRHITTCTVIYTSPPQSSTTRLAPAQQKSPCNRYLPRKLSSSLNQLLIRLRFPSRAESHLPLHRISTCQGRWDGVIAPQDLCPVNVDISHFTFHH